VKQSMTPNCMDCRATLAVTGPLFIGHVRCMNRFGRLAMTSVFHHLRWLISHHGQTRRAQGPSVIFSSMSI